MEWLVHKVILLQLLALGCTFETAKAGYEAASSVPWVILAALLAIL